ncbi:Lrp/AsnC family transcriptional regulator [Novosphingobium album (ex Liu et al. 2023)]|uniref:Lrp/AsnC family transcriptional regulator n=1 Tax=Novosphingobium album (ex Liu et al. 2023) TaxID=3031130 RepID=A0ABT5WQY5_9SPHN|nr:Lrp/AsnC family transcriptional regulator [Novosphingobium album (ex Liu et al. 2023)]MDE8652457.1 Lrp/AsnC family transcriptional regulator [Novosphingobium album (ex Liu et al. 2023)]
MSESIDRTDREIIRLLHLNARRPNSEIAAEVGLSPSACHRRIKILEDQGAIRGYTVVLAPLAAEAGSVDVLVRVTLERQTEDYLARFEHAVRQCPQIRECFLMTGEVDYWLRVQAENVAAYEVIHSEILSRMPGVTRITSSFAMRDALRPRRVKAGRRLNTGA